MLENGRQKQTQCVCWAKMLLWTTTQGSHLRWAKCYLVTRLKAEVALLMSKVLFHSDAQSRKWCAPPNTQWKSTDITTKIRGGSKALQIYEGRISRKTSSTLWDVICTKVLVSLSYSYEVPFPKNFSWVQGRAGTWKVLAPLYLCISNCYCMWDMLGEHVDNTQLTEQVGWRALRVNMWQHAS